MQTEKLHKLINNQHLLNNDTVCELKELVEEFPFFQAGWVLYLKNLKQINSPDYETVLKKVAVLLPNRKLLYRYLNSEIKSQPLVIQLENTETAIGYNLENDVENEQGNSLIDKFLSSGPGRINRNLEEEKEQTNKIENEVVKNSVLENDEIVTETLAMIYFQQKNYDKALESFRKLSLKYPEKSVYFATRIEEIEKLKNIN